MKILTRGLILGGQQAWTQNGRKADSISLRTASPGRTLRSFMFVSPGPVRPEQALGGAIKQGERENGIPNTSREEARIPFVPLLCDPCSYSGQTCLRTMSKMCQQPPAPSPLSQRAHLGPDFPSPHCVMCDCDTEHFLSSPSSLTPCSMTLPCMAQCSTIVLHH